MILAPLGSFEQGDRIQVVIPEINLEHQADRVYPNNVIGTVVLPYFTNEDGEVDIDRQKILSIQYERLVLIALDKSSMIITVPESLLKKLKPEDPEY